MSIRLPALSVLAATVVSAAALPSAHADCLEDFTPSVGAGVAARDLTLAQARDLAVVLHRDHAITLRAGFAPRFKETDDGCELTAPAPGQLSIDGMIAGVELRINYGRKTAASQSGYIIADPRLIVALHRTIVAMKAKWSLVGIHHKGVGPKASDTSGPHFERRAFDIAGLVLKEDDDNTLFYVQEDWADQAVPAGEAKAGKPSTWAADATTSFRLLSSGNTDQVRIWEDLYAALASDFYDTKTCGQTSKIGEGSQILTPDHPTESLRSKHQDHIHAEVPEKGWKCTPKVEPEYE